ncbi:cold shock domain-containing protein [Vibrio harveyi]|uniref:cold shock domain-containing protein n=1 Tax=Vibrio harveyi TaxID=669 RepID=UPI000680FAEF|nr:cold shock domain-containing protein [Vibrio harveyi]PNM43165.1 cold-shock protein [Vibrio harveyi]
MEGEIVRWVDERGFGFINSDAYPGDIFVHVSKFKKGYRRPKTSAHNVLLVGVEPIKNSSSSSILSVVLIGFALGVFGYFAFEKLFTTPEYENMGFVCEGKTRCSHMTSCNEAKFYLANCPNVQIDGDRDGLPCEMQWCTN